MDPRSEADRALDAAERGDSDGMNKLGILLYEQGDAEAAEVWFGPCSQPHA